MIKKGPLFFLLNCSKFAGQQLYVLAMVYLESGLIMLPNDS